MIVKSITSKIVLFFVALTLSLVGGAYLLSDKAETSVTKAQQEQEHNQAQSLTAKQNDTNDSGYVFSRPRNGTLIKTQEIEIQFNSDNTASANIPQNESTDIRKGQKVILYSTEGTVLPLGGVITAINESEEFKNITISLPKPLSQPKENNGEKTDGDATVKTENLSNKAKVITVEGPALQLFPLSALQYDKDNTPYVWEVNNEETRKKTSTRIQTKQNKNEQNETNDGSSNIIKRPLSSVLIGDKYFRAGRPITAYTYLILNPNAELSADITADIKETKFKVPVDNPIQESYIALKDKVITQRLEKMAKKTQECKARSQQGQQSNQPVNTTQQMSNSCGQEKLPRELSPEELFDSILSRRPKYTGGKICNGCAGSNP